MMHSASSASSSSGCPLLLGLPCCTGIGVDTSAAGAGGLRRKPRCSLLTTHCLPINSGDDIRLESFDIFSRRTTVGGEAWFCADSASLMCL